MKELPKIYDPKQVESKIYRYWTDGGWFHAERDPDKKPFTIVIPPPNVTGSISATRSTRRSRTCSSAGSA